jgi:predicted outer membrane repeat protein
LLVNNSYFEKNHCSKYGGAIYIGQGNHVRVENSEFVGNYAERGGAIFLGYVSSKLGCTNPVIDNCTFKDNGVFPAVFERNMTKGGAIYS